MNYVKLLQHITQNEKLIASDLKKNVFEDRYGCHCTLCEICVIELQIEWDNNLQKRIRTHHKHVEQITPSANRTIQYHSDGIDPFDKQSLLLKLL